MTTTRPERPARKRPARNGAANPARSGNGRAAGNGSAPARGTGNRAPIAPPRDFALPETATPALPAVAAFDDLDMPAALLKTLT
ncbi:DEAD/DEAH box helicase, partial [Streptomyces lavendulocolor]